MCIYLKISDRELFSAMVDSFGDRLRPDVNFSNCGVLGPVCSDIRIRVCPWNRESAGLLSGILRKVRRAFFLCRPFLYHIIVFSGLLVSLRVLVRY